LGVLVQGAGFVLLNPDADQLARKVMPFGERVQGFPRNELLRDLPLELDAVRAMLGHGFHPSKAQLTLSKQKPQPVRPKGRTPKDGVIGRPAFTAGEWCCASG
jgi:hypothetical protein